VCREDAVRPKCGREDEERLDCGRGEAERCRGVEDMVERLDGCRNTMTTHRQTVRKGSLLKVASILSFMHYIENTEETFL
jgi:hypothetical protein